MPHLTISYKKNGILNLKLELEIFVYALPRFNPTCFHIRWLFDANMSYGDATQTEQQHETQPYKKYKFVLGVTMQKMHVVIYLKRQQIVAIVRPERVVFHPGFGG